MNPDTLFTYCNYFAMLGWFILILSPLHKLLQNLVKTTVIPILLASIYLFIMITNFGTSAGDFGSLQGIMLLFSDENIVLAGWIHYLAFDLWVGSWELNDAKKRGIHHLIMIPCLLITFVFGPIGLLVYLIIRSIRVKRFLFHDNF